MDLKSNTGVPLSNAKFRLFRNGVFYATVWTGADGFADFGKVLPAQYALMQDTSSDNHIPVMDAVIKEVKNPQETGVFEYHIPVINEKQKETESSGSNGSSGGKNTSGASNKEEKEQTQVLPLPVTPNVPERIVPDVISSDMYLRKILMK